MKLEEAINVCLPEQCLGRDAWVKNGSLIRLISSARSIDELKTKLILTDESIDADDWEIYEIQE